MQWQRRVGLVVAILTLGLAACSEDASPAAPAEWAAGLCTAEQKFTEAIIASRDDVDDPSSLDLAARKDRVAKLGEAEIAASLQLQKDLEAIEPPADARDYHKALIAQAKDLAAAVKVQVEAIKKATTAQQIAVANASARFASQGGQTDVTAKAATVPQDLRDAIANQPECGVTPLPGTSPTPLATPSA